MIRKTVNGFEAGLTGPGSLQRVLCDEPYDIALPCRKTMVEYQEHFKTGQTGIMARRMKKQFVIMSKYRILCNDTSWPCKRFKKFQNVVRALCLTEYWNVFLFCFVNSYKIYAMVLDQLVREETVTVWWWQMYVSLILQTGQWAYVLRNRLSTIFFFA